MIYAGNFLNSFLNMCGLCDFKMYLNIQLHWLNMPKQNLATLHMKWFWGLLQFNKLANRMYLNIFHQIQIILYFQSARL